MRLLHPQVTPGRLISGERTGLRDLNWVWFCVAEFGSNIIWKVMFSLLTSLLLFPDLLLPSPISQAESCWVVHYNQRQAASRAPLFFNS